MSNQKQQSMAPEKLKRDQFFFYFNLLILVIVVGAFGVNGVVNYEDLPPISTIVIIHGIFMFAWYLLVVVQANFIRQRNYKIHMILGNSVLH